MSGAAERPPLLFSKRRRIKKPILSVHAIILTMWHDSYFENPEALAVHGQNPGTKICFYRLHHALRGLRVKPFPEIQTDQKR
jgi:hypothetical protein